MKDKKVIEEDFALGNEVYRDETGIYFIVRKIFVVHKLRRLGYID